MSHGRIAYISHATLSRSRYEKPSYVRRYKFHSKREETNEKLNLERGDASVRESAHRRIFHGDRDITLLRSTGSRQRIPAIAVDPYQSTRCSR